MSEHFILLGTGEKCYVDFCDKVYFDRWIWRATQDTKYAFRVSHRDGKFVGLYLHVEIAKAAGLDTSNLIDHIDQDKMNCRRGNLRPATKNQNGMNCKTRSTSRSGYKGVSFFKRDRNWSAYITHQGIKQHLGYFSTPKAAAIEYNNAAIRLFGKFASLNQID